MKSVVKSFRYAFRGICVTFRAERNFKIHMVALCLAVTLGVYLGLSALEWGLVVFAVGIVLAAELFNTALERLGDETAGGKLNGAVRDAKDISAGAVLLSAFTAFVIGVIVLFVPLVRRLLE